MNLLQLSSETHRGQVETKQKHRVSQPDHPDTLERGLMRMYRYLLFLVNIHSQQSTPTITTPFWAQTSSSLPFGFDFSPFLCFLAKLPAASPIYVPLGLLSSSLSSHLSLRCLVPTASSIVVAQRSLPEPSLVTLVNAPLPSFGDPPILIPQIS